MEDILQPESFLSWKIMVMVMEMALTRRWRLPDPGRVTLQV